MRRLQSLFLIFVAAWLPLQAAAAAAMPFCRHSEQQAPAAAMVEHTHCHEDMGAAEDAPAAPVVDLGCDNCEICHFATAGFLPVGGTTTALPMTDIFVAGFAAVSPSFIADPPDQPPRR